MKKMLLGFLVSSLPFAFEVFAQNGTPDRVVTFKFVPGQDMFYSPWEGNGEQLRTLYSLVEEYRNEIASGEMPVYVDGYTSSMRSRERNLELSFVRANRVKSELISRKGLVEGNFITRNYADAYTGADGTVYKDLVVVTLRIPAEIGPVVEQPGREDEEAPAAAKPEPVREEPPVVKQEPAAEAEQEPKKEPQPEPVVESIPEPVATHSRSWRGDPYRFAVRTNLFYDAFLLPTLGAEWRINDRYGVTLDGSRSWWGGAHGRVQKIWIVSPEARYYLGNGRRWYAGLSANFGQYNVYKYIIGSLKSDNTGYQGSFWNAGISGGYQLCLSPGFSLDFNLGLGYTRFDYDSFRMADGVRIYKDRDRTKNFWGPTQAGVSLVWTIGDRK